MAETHSERHHAADVDRATVWLRRTLSNISVTDEEKEKGDVDRATVWLRLTLRSAVIDVDIERYYTTDIDRVTVWQRRTLRMILYG